MKIIFLISILFWLSSCQLISPEDENPVEVVPWKLIPCSPEPNEKSIWGRVPASKEQAENYDVIVGWKKFQEIIGKKNNSQAEKVAIFGKFAVKKVVSLGYCQAAEVPEKSKYILGWEGSGRHGINVVCKS